MTDVMTQDHKVKLPSISELTIGLRGPQLLPSPTQPPPRTQQPVEQPGVVLPSIRASTSSYSSDASNSRQSSISTIPAGPPQYGPPPVAMTPQVQGSPIQSFQPVPATLAPQQPQYIHMAMPSHNMPPDMILVPGPVSLGIPPQHVHTQPMMLQQQQQHHHHHQPQVVYPAMHNAPPSVHNDRGLQQPRKKRPRRKANEMVRLYACNYKGCRNSYGTLNHLNAHITFKRHGPKRKPEEFKQIRELYKLQKNLSEKKRVAGENGDLKTEESIKLLANLSEKLIDSDKAELPVFHQQRGYNGYGRFDHTVKKDELAEKLPEVLTKQP